MVYMPKLAHLVDMFQQFSLFESLRPGRPCSEITENGPKVQKTDTDEHGFGAMNEECWVDGVQLVHGDATTFRNLPPLCVRFL